MAEQQQKLWSARNVPTYPAPIFTNQQYLITELIVSSSFTKINTACLRATASSQPELSPTLALLMRALLLLAVSKHFPSISLSRTGMQRAWAWSMEHGDSPNLHQEHTEAPQGWLWSLSAASALLHNPQLVLLHPSTAQTRIDPMGQWAQSPTHPPQ